MYLENAMSGYVLGREISTNKLVGLPNDGRQTERNGKDR